MTIPDAGVATDDIIAVLALQSTCMLIGDGHSSAAAVLLLKDGRLLAATAFIDEASGLVNYGSIIVSATFYADTCEMLFDALPSFAQAASFLCFGMVCCYSRFSIINDSIDIVPNGVLGVVSLQILTPEIGKKMAQTCLSNMSTLQT